MTLLSFFSMANMKIEKISRQVIKPSSPTPPQFRTSKLSLLDQLSHLMYTPIILYYPLSYKNCCKSNQVVIKLKNSLSVTLSRFYPIAGRIIDHVSIDCSDEGVPFFEAKVSFELAEFLEQPKIDLPKEFLPCEPYRYSASPNVEQVAVQVNVFADGGIAICVCFLHKIIDAATMSAFLKSWAAFAKGSPDQALFPDFAAGAQLFPPGDKELGMWLLMPRWIEKRGNGVHRRFVFDAAAISTLKKMAKSEQMPNPSRVMAISCFIWKHVMAACTAANHSQHKHASMLAFAVNIRKQIAPPQISESFGGNMVWRAITSYTTIPGENLELQILVLQMKEAIAKIDYHYVERLKGDQGLDTYIKYREGVDAIISKENPEFYIFTSWCNFGFTEVDFGWGKPAWVSNAGNEVNSVFSNHLLLIETCLGDGIEALLVLDEPEMAILENDREFLKFAYLNPCISITKDYELDPSSTSLD